MADLQGLKKLTKTDLLDLLNSIYGYDSAVDDYIEQAAANAQGNLKKQLVQLISALKRGRKFIDYGQSFTFARQLEPVLSGLDTLIQQAQYADAF